MNFLQLCQRLRQECGGSGTGPASVISQTGENKLWVDWINQAYLEIQADRPGWNWLWATDSLTVAAGTSLYTLASPTIQRETVRLDGGLLRYIAYADWPYFDLAAGTPSQFTLRPDGRLQLNTTPVTGHTLTYDYHAEPAIMSADADEPALPSRFHMLIVYKAMQYYAGYENAPEVMQSGVRNYEQMLALLDRDELQDFQFAGPLA